MKAFLLYCLFLFPFSYAITKDSYMEQNSTRCHSSAEQDTLYIETEKAEKLYIGYAWINKVERMLSTS